MKEKYAYIDFKFWKYANVKGFSLDKDVIQ